MPPNIVEFTSLHSFTLSHPPNQEQCVCVCVCLLSIEIQTAGWIAMKFAMEVVLEGRKVRGGSTLYPRLHRYWTLKGGAGCLWSLSCAFWQKLGHPQFSGGTGHLFGPQILIWKNLRPMSFWRHGHPHWKGVVKSKVVGDHPKHYLVTPTLTLGSKGGGKRGPNGVLEPQARILANIFMAQKFERTPNLAEVSHLLGPQIWIWKDLGHMSFCSYGTSLSRGVHNMKVVVHVPSRYLVIQTSQ